MKAKPNESTHTEYDENEEEEKHEYVGQFMTESPAEQISALWEEVEGKLFHISFVDDQEYYSWERVFSEELWDAVIEEGLEGKIHQYVDEDAAWELIKEEVEIVGEKAQPAWIFGNDICWSVIKLIVKVFKSFFVKLIVWFANNVTVFA